MAVALAATLVAARAAFLAPVPSLRYVGFDGLQVQSGCLDGTAGPRARVWACTWDVHVDSRLEILNHDHAAMDWCASLVRDGQDHDWRRVRLGSLLSVALFPPVWGGWTGCNHLIPLSVGFTAHVAIDH